MRGLSATDDDILRRTFVISVSASGNFLWFLLCLERSCGRCVCLPVPTCGHAILCVPQSVSRASVDDNGKCPPSGDGEHKGPLFARLDNGHRSHTVATCHGGEAARCLVLVLVLVLPCCAPSSQTEATSGDSFLVHT